MLKASHYPTLNIHVEACGTSEMGYYKRLSHVREQEKHGAHRLLWRIHVQDITGLSMVRDLFSFRYVCPKSEKTFHFNSCTGYRI